MGDKNNLFFMYLDLNSKWNYWLPTFLLSFLLFSVFLLGFSIEASAQQINRVDFKQIAAVVSIDTTEKRVDAHYTVSFKVLKNTDSIYLDAKGMTLKPDGNSDLILSSADDKIWMTGHFQEGKTYTTSFEYAVFPTQSLYFMPWGISGVSTEIWTQGQGKFTSHWLPSIDDVNDKIEFDLSFVAPKNKNVIANGKLMNITSENTRNIWHFDMKEPMSSYLVAFAMGDFTKKELFSSSGIPIELYYKPDDSLKVEPTYRYSKQIFDFLETEIGVPYPWQNYKQVPLRDFLYAGMENTTATFFSEAFVVDSIGFNDRNYVNVNAHELAHQWFGDMVTAKSDKDHWLQEGFATYYALLAEKEIFGDEYFYWQLYQTAEQLKALSDEGKGESLLNPKASSLTFYQKGAWALHILRETIGDSAFKLAIKNYLEKHRFTNVSTEDFLIEVRAVSDTAISPFEINWLQQSAFRSEEAYQSLKKSPFIMAYFEVAALRAVPLIDKKAQLRSALTLPNDFIGQEVVYQLASEPVSKAIPLYKKAFKSENPYIRQAVALSMREIPMELQTEYRSLLNDPSYVTLEFALHQIWAQFPGNRHQYLDQTKGIEGFQNKNIRQLWLALAWITKDYNNSKKEEYLLELKNYTSPRYSFEIREKAFEYVNELQFWDVETLKNLVEACVHPAWRFAKSSKELLGEVLRNKQYHEQVKVLGKNVTKKAADYLNSIIKE